MDKKNHFISQIFNVLILIAITICAFEYSPADIYIQNIFYNSMQHKWLIDDADYYTWLFLYKGIKIAIATITVVTLISYIRKPKKQKLLFILSVILIPSIIAIGKKYTNIYCPESLEIFGGDRPYIRVFGNYPENFTDKPGKCFPAGHASGGFALMCLYFIWNKWKYFGLTIGILLGWIMGLYQMAKGNHFFSDTLVTMEVAWLIILLLQNFLYCQKNQVKS